MFGAFVFGLVFGGLFGMLFAQRIEKKHANVLRGIIEEYRAMLKARR